MRALGVLYLVLSLGAGCAVSDATSVEETHGSVSADALVEEEPEPSEEPQRPVIEDVEEPPSEQACSSGPRWGAELTLFRERDRALEVYNWEGAPLEVPGFTHSVASGDPRSDRVILWTRFEAAVDDLPVDVYWEVAIDADFDFVWPASEDGRHPLHGSGLFDGVLEAEVAGDGEAVEAFDCDAAVEPGTDLIDVCKFSGGAEA